MDPILHSFEQFERLRQQRAQSGVLFHYTTKERAIENIFKDMEIRLGPLASMNDPRERDPWFFGVAQEDGEAEMTTAEREGFEDCVHRVFKQSVRLLCLTREEEKPPGGVLMGWGHDRMWAQYAGNHTGVCIAFDRKKLGDRIFEHFLADKVSSLAGAFLPGEVRYHRYFEHDDPENPFDRLSLSKMREVGFFDYLRLHRHLMVRNLYLMKNEDWMSESEYRFVWLGADGTDTPIFVPIDGCVTDIFLGPYFPEVYHQNIRSIQQRTGIIAWTSQYWNGLHRISLLPPA